MYDDVLDEGDLFVYKKIIKFLYKDLYFKFEIRMVRFSRFFLLRVRFVIILGEFISKEELSV